jgi:hypothetical protein
MLVEDIKFPIFWTSINKLMKCEVKYTFKSEIFKDEPGIVVLPIIGMEKYQSIDGLVPFSLKIFLASFEPKLES